MKPRAKKTRVVGVHGEALHLAVAAPPVDGAANAEVLRALAELFGVPKGRLVLVRGASSRVKLVEVADVAAEVLAASIARAIEASLAS